MVYFYVRWSHLLWKMKNVKHLYFFFFASFDHHGWKIDILTIFPHPITSPLITKSSYLTYMSDLKDNCTLFSLTLKVEEIKVPLFSWSEVNLQDTLVYDSICLPSDIFPQNRDYFLIACHMYMCFRNSWEKIYIY